MKQTNKQTISPTGNQLNNAPSPECWEALYFCGHTVDSRWGQWAIVLRRWGLRAYYWHSVRLCTILLLLASYGGAAGLQLPFWRSIFWCISLLSWWARSPTSPAFSVQEFLLLEGSQPADRAISIILCCTTPLSIHKPSLKKCRAGGSCPIFRSRNWTNAMRVAY